jgi:hypothetical protein
MTVFPTGCLVAFISLAVGMLLWQRVAHWSYLAMGLSRVPPVAPSEMRSKLLRFLIWGGSAWFLAFSGGAIGSALMRGSHSPLLYVLGGAALVPVVVAPGALRALRELKINGDDGAAAP